MRVPAAGLWLTVTALGLGALGLAPGEHEEALVLGARLAALGPSPDERLAAAAASPEERAALRGALARGDVPADVLAAEHGARAVATATAALEGDEVAPVRLGARTLLVLVEERADARWLAWYLDAPGALIRAYGRSPELDRELDQALAAVAGGVRRQGPAEWTDWWLEARGAFEDAEQRAAERREDLLRRLRAGR